MDVIRVVRCTRGQPRCTVTAEERQPRSVVGFKFGRDASVDRETKCRPWISGDASGSGFIGWLRYTFQADKSFDRRLRHLMQQADSSNLNCGR